MHKLPRIGNDISFLHRVTKFLATVKKHRVSRGEDLTICPCRSCKNKLPHEDDVVKYHLIRYGFVENYTMCNFHGEAHPSVTGASEPNTSTPTSVNERG